MKVIGGTVAALALVGAWYWFRPERLWIDERVDESLVTSASESTPIVEATGRFHGVAHETRGQVAVLRRANGERILRFTDFSTSNGPDVRVLLVATVDANDNAAVASARTLEIAPLKGNVGDQNYALPADADLDVDRSVVIWCHRFGVNFAAAPLTQR